MGKGEGRTYSTGKYTHRQEEIMVNHFVKNQNLMGVMIILVILCSLFI